MRAEADALIEKYGFMLQAVFGGEDNPSFIYSIGLAQRGLPEFIFVGSCQPQASDYLMGAIEAAMAGTKIEPGLVAPESEINPYMVPAWILQADDKLQTHAYGVTGQLARQGLPAEATLFQVVMPDMSGRFPWENNYDWVDQQITTPPVVGNA